MKRPFNQLTRMRDAAELVQIIEQNTCKTPTLDEEKRLVKLAHKHYCTLAEIRVQYNLSTTEDEAISKIYLTLAQAEPERIDALAQAETERIDAKLHSNTTYGKLVTTEKEI